MRHNPSDLGSWCIKGTDESTLGKGLSVPLMHHDPSDLGSWCIKGTDESTLGKGLSVPLMHHDLSDLGSKLWIRIFPKKCTLSLIVN